MSIMNLIAQVLYRVGMNEGMEIAVRTRHLVGDASTQTLSESDIFSGGPMIGAQGFQVAAPA